MTINDQLKILVNKIRLNKLIMICVERMLRFLLCLLENIKLKNIEDKTDNQLRPIEGRKDNQLDLVENQKTKQSDPTGKIKFNDEKLEKLAEDVIKKTKKYEDEDLE